MVWLKSWRNCANAYPLAVGANRQGREHCCFRAFSIRQFNPGPRKHDMPERPARVFGEPLTQDAAVGPKGVQKRNHLLRSEGGVYNLAGWSAVVRPGCAEYNRH